MKHVSGKRGSRGRWEGGINFGGKKEGIPGISSKKTVNISSSQNYCRYIQHANYINLEFLQEKTLMLNKGIHSLKALPNTMPMCLLLVKER